MNPSSGRRARAAGPRGRSIGAPAWLAAASVLLATPIVGAELTWSVRSPNANLVAVVTLDPGAAPALSYHIELADGSKALEASPLGIRRADLSFVEGLRFDSAEPIRTVSDTYTLVHGKQKECRHHANELKLHLTNDDGEPLIVVFRVANDGVAFRYQFPAAEKLPAADEDTRTVVSEATGFRLPGRSTAWIQPAMKPSLWGPGYEDYYSNGESERAIQDTGAPWCFPALFRLPEGDRWVLLTEAALDAGYAGCGLSTAAGDGTYRIRFPQAGEGGGRGAVSPRSTLPWGTPWRVVVVGSLDTIVESTLVTDLSPPCAVERTDWVRPGRASWSWWSDHDSPQDYDSLKEFVDLSAEMGWEYSLVDANWTLMRGGDVQQLAEYAREKGVRLLLWYNSGGEHNSITEKPRGCLNDRRVRRFEFDLIRSWGIAGVKIDFFQSDKQDRIQQYLGILQDAADHELLVNFHGCTIPRGWSRTFPNLMTMEAVRGAETYTFGKGFAERASVQNAILPFTRNAVGPMDYTPVTWSPQRFPSVTTIGHELALSVLFQSGLQHFADSAETYRAAPAPVQDWLRLVPANWDETRYLGGAPGEWVALARRAGREWFVGVANSAAARAVTIDLSPLNAADWTMAELVDRGPREVAAATTERAPDRVDLDLLPHGGAVFRLSP